MAENGDDLFLIADSGSTKTEWKVVENRIASTSVFSAGINPFFLTSEEILELLNRELASLKGKKFAAVYFYGTGVNSPVRASTINNALSGFLISKTFFTTSDLLGAARSLCLDKPGIACIIGTGSNSCYYDGKSIAANVAPLGYILGDEGGAAVLGRKLIAGVLKKQLPAEISEKFFESYK
jgi:N-acetylglucosamine kinase-like BadF-type ATPase